jgi:phosphoribosyl-ATP pyrophosphohydrolase
MTKKKAEYKTEFPPVEEAREVREAEEARNHPEQPKTIDQMTVTELKALAFDQMVILQQTQNNINIIQAEITKRGKVPGA